ncbi:uncharacterized protein BO80DRAFT_434706 [Aspergillus ibericus CBS 121593]|uniref:Uncharacterized protein n=1 Tax=Aspergillus ibericus CBS 121593 TaxID=1448316 RepID=A0A395H497_9EURO|nr:hypothetical protein BO80DRAFT_434706 [Aspergillus ibericus CBS 121593]RAL01044.1 hypothetical protein BO80DRAFT_434706 [Aspergillus ibericus CBS 121593]
MASVYSLVKAIAVTQGYHSILFLFGHRTMDQFQESPEHAARRTAVRNIWKSVLGLNHVTFQPMENNIPDPDPELLEIEFPPYDPQDDFPEETVYWAEGVSRYVEEYIHGIIVIGLTDDRDLPSDPSSEELWNVVGADIRWFSTAISHIPNQPSFKCMMASNIDGDGRPTRWELECICKSMEKLLNRRVHAKHLVTPVMILSYMGPRQVRILLAHFDGTDLVIRKSQFYDLWTENVEALRLLVRRWCASESGDTFHRPSLGHDRAHGWH